MNQAPKSQPPNMILLCQDRLLLELIGEGKESLEKALMVDFTWDIETYPQGYLKTFWACFLDVVELIGILTRCFS